jgi:hypothetical protein
VAVEGTELVTGAAGVLDGGLKWLWTGLMREPAEILTILILAFWKTEASFG